MSYLDRCAKRAYELVDEFARDKMRNDISPDIIHHQVEHRYNNRTQSLFVSDSRNLDGWIISSRDGKCIIGLEDGSILIGELKLRHQLFGGDEKKSSSYCNWREFSKDKLLWGSNRITVDIAEAIVNYLGANN